MNKTKKYILSGTVGLSIFMIGSVVGAQSESWIDLISQDAAQQINEAGKNKKDELTTNVQEKIKQKVKDKINPEISEREAAIQSELEAYFDQKLESVANTPEYNAAVSDLDRIKANLLADYKREIDSAFTK